MRKSVLPFKSHVSFLDASADLDQFLRLIGNLCTQSGEIDIPAEWLRELGTQIGHYLDRRVILEHVYFGRGLSYCRLDSNGIRAEKIRYKTGRALP